MTARAWVLGLATTPNSALLRPVSADLLVGILPFEARLLERVMEPGQDRGELLAPHFVPTT